jgi:hypothetical protein
MHMLLNECVNCLSTLRQKNVIQFLHVRLAVKFELLPPVNIKTNFLKKP